MTLPRKEIVKIVNKRNGNTQIHVYQLYNITKHDSLASKTQVSLHIASQINNSTTLTTL